MRVGFLLPLIFGGVLFHLLGRIILERLQLRERVLYALLGTSVYLVAMTELLSALQELTTLWVTLFWALGAAGLLFICRVTGIPVRECEKFGGARDSLSRILLGLIVLFVATSAVLAAFATPNGWDAMTYHLPRLAHWLQDRSIGIYATNCMYQNQHSPFAEWSMLHLALLQGNDHLLAFVQWISFAGSIITVSLLTEACGGSRKAGVLAAFFTATMPMTLLQASGTENDDVVAFFILCTAYGFIRAGKDDRFHRVIFAGVALALALLTKATAYLFSPIFVLWMMVAWRRNGISFLLTRITLIMLIVLLLNAGYYGRNLGSSGTWLGNDRDSGPGYNYANEVHTPGAIFSNILRNLSLQTPSYPPVISLVFRVVTKMHHLVGLDPNDPRTTSYGPVYFIPGAPSLENGCANPWQALVFIMGGGVMILNWRRFGAEAKFLAFSVLTGAFLFCLILKWQPFHSRLHIPLLMLGMPVAAIALEVVACRLLTLFWIGLMLAQSLPLVLHSSSQPLVASSNIFNRSPSVQRFFYGPYDRPDYEAAVQFLKENQVKLVGLIGPMNNSGWEYPLFDPDDMNFGYPWRIESVQVENCYAPLETKAVPDAVILLKAGGEDVVTVHGQAYHRVLQGRTLSVYGK